MSVQPVTGIMIEDHWQESVFFNDDLWALLYALESMFDFETKKGYNN